jgi:hypothetical protein
MAIADAAEHGLGRPETGPGQIGERWHSTNKLRVFKPFLFAAAEGDVRVFRGLLQPGAQWASSIVARLL